MSISIELLLQILIVFQCFVFGLFLWITKKGKRRANRFLALLVGLLFIQFVSNVIEAVTGFFHSNYLISVRLLYGPTIFFYTKEMIYSELNYSKSDLWHLALPILFIFYSPFFSFDDQQWIVGTIIITILAYIGGSLFLIHQYQKGIRQIRSDVEKVSLNWIRQLIISFLVVLALDITYQIFGRNLTALGEDLIYIIQLVMVLFLITMMVMKALAQPQIFNGFTVDRLMELNTPKQKYSSSSLKEIDLIRFEENIKIHLETQKSYLNPQYSLAMLADEIGITQRDLSFVINDRFKKNFFEFINAYRIEYAKELLIKSKDKKLTILEIIYETGFNSKSSFYTAFRSHTNMTPKEFKSSFK